jgi:hypothetical protein
VDHQILPKRSEQFSSQTLKRRERAALQFR